MKHQLYCLDANVLIVPWQTYYAYDICPSYWDFLNTLGERNTVFIPDDVFGELKKAEDGLYQWVKSSKIPIMKKDVEVANCLIRINAANPIHKLLSDDAKNRSVADPWVIAHAMRHNACVVTKEIKIPLSQKRIKIPNVCENMQIPCINDFELGRNFGLTFTCST
ncbi:DUF4411 family protein [Spirosoma panaciterrae]|uniref:DUF4411 family protein n=1 Tax=Spirosoma panaciterrae TaxID=496058 RepID=UPI000382164B|nr:DUF4411 family protein [Spirosoma panaciterrae]